MKPYLMKTINCWHPWTSKIVSWKIPSSIWDWRFHLRIVLQQSNVWGNKCVSHRYVKVLLQRLWCLWLHPEPTLSFQSMNSPLTSKRSLRLPQKRLRLTKHSFIIAIIPLTFYLENINNQPKYINFIYNLNKLNTSVDFIAKRMPRWF